MSTKLRPTVALASAFAAWSVNSAVIAQAPQATVLLQTRTPIAPGSAVMIETIRHIEAAGLDRFAATIGVSGGVTWICGRTDANPAAPLEWVVPASGTLQRYRFEDRFGLNSAGMLAYSSTVTNGPASPFVGYRDSVWRGPLSTGTAGAAVAVTGAAASPPFAASSYWRSASQPGITTDGRAYWLGAKSSSAAGLPESRAVVLADGQVLGKLLADDEPLGDIEGTPAAVLAIRSFSLTPSGSVLIAIATAQVSGAPVEIVVRRALPASIATEPLGELTPVARAGGPSGDPARPAELWRSFGAAGASDQAECPQYAAVWVTGRTNSPSAADDVLAIDGGVRFREGDVIEGHRLLGGPMHVTTNVNGDLAFIWQTQRAGDADPAPRTTLFVNGQPLFERDSFTTAGAPVLHVYPMGALAARDPAGIARFYGKVRLIGSDGYYFDSIVELQIPLGAAACCLADFNNDGSLDPDDLADYLGGFFSEPSDPRCDMNDDGSVDPDDLADYISAFFTGC